MRRWNSRYPEIRRLAECTKPYRSSYVLGLLGCCLIDSSLPLVMPLLIKFVLDAVVVKDMHSIWLVCITFAVGILLLCGLIRIVQYRFGAAVKTIMADLRLRLFSHLQKLPVAYFEQTHSGDSMSRINNDLGVVEYAFAGKLRSLIRLILTGGYSTALMFIFDWRFASAMIGLGLASTLVNVLLARPIRKRSAEIQKYAGERMERFMDILAGTQASRIFAGSSNPLILKFREVNDRLLNLSVDRCRRSAILNGMNYFLMWMKNSGAFIVGTFMLVNGEMTLGTLLSLVLLLEQVTNLFRQLGNLWIDLQSSLTGAARVFELLDTAEEPDRYPVRADISVFEGASDMIAIDNGTFSYKPDQTILQGFTIALKKGGVVALVGPSGSGKSTVLKLLLGFYPLDKGEIRIEGKPFSDYTLSELRERMAYVSQDSYLFEGTIEENIRYGRPDASFEEVQAAARSANAHPFIVEQADGYQTMVGERGTRLSGGQKQRIAIARAFLKNAPILLLDEATSALDSESEQAVQEGLQQLMKGKTTLVIAHRLSTIKNADAIYVVDKGMIAEQGTHVDLLKTGGVYSRLYFYASRAGGCGLIS